MDLCCAVAPFVRSYKRPCASASARRARTHADFPFLRRFISCGASRNSDACFSASESSEGLAIQSGGLPRRTSQCHAKKGLCFFIPHHHHHHRHPRLPFNIGATQYTHGNSHESRATNRSSQTAAAVARACGWGGNKRGRNKQGTALEGPS